MIKIIVATDEHMAIGRNGDLLCHLSGDMRHFRELTMGGAIVMGRKTWESYPRRPLPGRHNIIITRSHTYVAEGATVVHSLEDALSAANNHTNSNANNHTIVPATNNHTANTSDPHTGNDLNNPAPTPDIWILGGGSIYKEAMEKNLPDELEITEIHHTFADADTWFPALDDKWLELSRESHPADDKNEFPYSFVRYKRK